MRKPVLPRIAGLVFIYIFIFFALIIIQFSGQGNFTRKIGALTVSGHTKNTMLEDEAQNGAEFLLEGFVNVSFGGLEFRLGKEINESGLGIIYQNDEKIPLSPQSMTLNEESVRFLLGGGVELTFYVHSQGDTEELIVSGIFPDNAAILELPLIIPGSSKTETAPDSNFIVISNKGKRYTFDRAIVDLEKKFLVLSNNNPVVSYKEVNDSLLFNPVDFIVSGGMEKALYDSLVKQWTDTAFSVWRQSVRDENVDERLAAAYVSEAARRDSYSAAVMDVPASLRSSAARTFVSSPFLGRMDSGLRSFSEYERDRIDDITALITQIENNQSSVFALFREEHIIEFLAVRGETALADKVGSLIQSMAPSAVPLDLSAAVFEIWRDWFIWRPDTGNPFEDLAASALDTIAENVIKTNDNHVFVFSAAEAQTVSADLLFNARLGGALVVYGEFTAKSEWAAVGRSIVLSVLSLSDASASVYEKISISGEGVVYTDKNTPKKNALDFYCSLTVSEFYPHTAGFLPGGNAVWLWTISPAVSALYENNVLDISVNFIVGETHYLIIRGIRPFSKIQLRSMDYRSDPQFESYNAPGWAYSAAEQTLLVKMVHRTQNENIRIFYTGQR
jgi:hypothetical protein